jgi:hypothetical protein
MCPEDYDHRLAACAELADQGIEKRLVAVTE